MSAIEYARNELQRIIDQCEDEESRTMQQMITENILQIVGVFSEQGHSGHSAGYAIYALERLLRFKPLTPLTGEAEEWNYIYTDNYGSALYQNKRCSSVFKEVDKEGNILRCDDNDGIICSDNGGITWFTTGRYRKQVEFPYMPPKDPEKVYLKEDPDGNEHVITDEAEIRALYEEKRKEFDSVEWE